jgi:hypothetical protein
VPTRDRYIAAGRCATCGARPASGGRQTCDVCSSRDKAKALAARLLRACAPAPKALADTEAARRYVLARVEGRPAPYEWLVGPCWDWTLATHRKGYGSASWSGRKTPAHRLSYMAFRGEIDAVVVRHLCDRPICCSPCHLAAGSLRDNAIDMVARGRRFAPNARGENHGRSKLSDEAVRELRAAAEHSTQRALADRFGIDRSQVSRILSGARRPDHG